MFCVSYLDTRRRVKLDAHRLSDRRTHFGWVLMRIDAQLYWRLESFWARRPAEKHGRWDKMMLLTKPSTAQGGKPVVFHNGHY